MELKRTIRHTIGLALILATGVAAASAPGTKLPEETEQALEAAVAKWIESKAEGSENKYGKKTKRGYFSRDFVPAGGNYLGTAHIETAGEETKTTERFELTLKPNGKVFDVTGEELRDTYAGLHRETHAACHPFEKFAFDREGMHLAGSNGEVCTDFYRGGVGSFRLQSADLTYRYEPPEYARNLHLNRDFHSIFDSVRKDHERELEFKPAALFFDCDPETCESLLKEHFSGLDRKPVADSGDEYEVVGTHTGWDQPVVKNTETERRESPFAHFRRPYETGNRAWSVFVAREVAPFLYPGFEEGLFDFGGALPGSGVQLAFNNWGGFEVELNVWPRRLDVPEQVFATLYGYYSEETLKEEDPYTLERREDQGARWHHVRSVRGDVDLGLTDPELLEADVTFGIELKQPRRELPFFIQSIPQREFTGKNKPRFLQVNSVQLDGKELTWTRTSQLGGIVILPAEMPAGTKLNLRMNFATRALYKVNVNFTLVSRFGWMPFVRFADFIDEFELTLRVPTGYKVLGIGQKATEKVEGNVTVTHWKADSAVVFPSITFGRYEEDGPGKDFKPATKADGTPIQVTVHVDKSSFTDWEIRPSALRPIAQQAVNSINLYRELSGVDYPYGELNFVNDPFGFLYGQAPSSLIYLGSGVFRGEGFLAPFFNEPTSIAKFLKSVTAHEVGHQWWGSRASNANDRNYWFVESLAEFFSGLYLEQVFGEKEYQDQVEEWRRNILDARMKSSVQNASSTWSGEDGFGSYQAAVYNKGPYAFHMLREIFGDEKFFPALKQFSQELMAKQEIVTLDIQHAAEKSLGGVDPEGNHYNADLGWFFDQWLRGTGIPQYRLTYDVRQTEDGSWLIEGVIEQRVVAGSSRSHTVVEGQYYRGVVDLTVKAKGGDFQKRLVVEGPQTPFKLKVAQRPMEVALNENREILAHDVLVNKSWD